MESFALSVVCTSSLTGAIWAATQPVDGAPVARTGRSVQCPPNEALSSPPLLSACYPGRFGLLHSQERGTLRTLLPRAARPATQPTDGALSGRMLPSLTQAGSARYTATDGHSPDVCYPRRLGPLHSQQTGHSLDVCYQPNPGRLGPLHSHRQALSGRMLPRAARSATKSTDGALSKRMLPSLTQGGSAHYTANRRDTLRLCYPGRLDPLHRNGRVLSGRMLPRAVRPRT